MNRRLLLSIVASLCVGGAVHLTIAQSSEIPLAAKLEVASASAEQSAIAMTAWKNRDPALFMTTVEKDFRLTRPDGSVLTWESLFERQKHQMASLQHTDRFVLTIEVESVAADSAIVLSTQDWTRVVKGSDGKDVRYKTGVTHREKWNKVGGQWKMDGFTEHNQVREKLDDATIKDREEHYEILVKLTDSREI
jgi:hypothetical protein